MSQWEGLNAATLCGNLNVIKVMLRYTDVDIEHRDGYDMTPLQRAAHHAKKDAFKLLLLRGELSTATACSRYLCSALFLASGADPSAQSSRKIPHQMDIKSGINVFGMIIDNDNKAHDLVEMAIKVRK